ncbi:tetratricopeptide repeat protein [Streptomyces sp. NPDC002156]
MSHSVFQGHTAVQTGACSTQNNQFVYQWKPAYRIEEFPTEPEKVLAWMVAEQPARLLRAAHQVVPFTGREEDLTALARWRDDSAHRLAVRLVHGPGGQGKSRLAVHFARLSRDVKWTVWEAVHNEADASPLRTTPPPEAPGGLLLVVDYAERWPTTDLHRLLQEPLVACAQGPVRVLLLARPAGFWWQSLKTWILDECHAPAQPHPLLPLASAARTPASGAVRGSLSPTRTELFVQSCQRFADRLGLPPDQAARIELPPDLDTKGEYAQVLTIHIAALAAVDAQLNNHDAPVSPARASAYLLEREGAYWGKLHQRKDEPLSTTPVEMGRLVLTATLTRPLTRLQGQTALARIGIADSVTAANRFLDDHRHPYPPPPADPTRDVTVLEPLYPDRLGEDFIGLITPATDTLHPVPEAVVDDWAHQAAERLLTIVDAESAAPWTREALTVLIETASRWPHIATGQLFPLLKKHPELAVHAGSNALAALAGLDSLDITVLEAIEPHLPSNRQADLDVGIAAFMSRLAEYRLATTHDPGTRAFTLEILALRQSWAGLHHEAVTASSEALGIWREITRTDASHRSDLARALCDHGTYLSGTGQWQEALATAHEGLAIEGELSADSATAFDAKAFVMAVSNYSLYLSKTGHPEQALSAVQDAVNLYRRLQLGDSAAYATLLANLGIRFAEAGNPEAGLPPLEQAVEIRRRLAAAHPAAYKPRLADALIAFGGCQSLAGEHDKAAIAAREAVDLYREYVRHNPASHESNFSGALSNLALALREVERWQEALSAAEEAVEIRRRLAAANPTAHQPELAAVLSNLALTLSDAERWEEGLSAAEEAVEIRRRLTAADTMAYSPALASSLTSLAEVKLGARRDLSGALRDTGEAVEIHRKLARSTPDVYTSHLLHVLGVQATVLVALGRLEEAQAVERWLIANGTAATKAPDNG